MGEPSTLKLKSAFFAVVSMWNHWICTILSDCNLIHILHRVQCEVHCFEETAIHFYVENLHFFGIELMLYTFEVSCSLDVCKQARHQCPLTNVRSINELTICMTFYAFPSTNKCFKMNLIPKNAVHLSTPNPFQFKHMQTLKPNEFYQVHISRT